jgi:hypothetical protein
MILTASLFAAVAVKHEDDSKILVQTIALAHCTSVNNILTILLKDLVLAKKSAVWAPNNGKEKRVATSVVFN